MSNRNATSAFAIAVVALAGSSAHAQVAFDRPLGGIITTPRRHGDCITPAARAAIERRIARYQATHPPFVAGESGDGPLLYTFYPHAGTLYRDLNTGNFVDLNPTVGPTAVQNYLCATYGNDGHNGCDTGTLSWAQMAIGLPVYAALDGVVIDRADGFPDMNLSCQPDGNYVILDHGGGRHTWYLHLKTGSVAVVLSQVVKAGQQLGLTGSSGCSFGPHLHFESRQGGAPYEPFAGACRPGPSGFASQIDPPAGVAVLEFGVTSQDIGAAPAWPNRPPTSAQIAMSDPLLYYWIQCLNLPANSTWKERYVRPDSTVSFELGPFPFNNGGPYAWSLFWFSRNVFEMHSIPGTWRIQFEINGVQVIDAPVEVVATITPGFNRPPAQPSAAFDPPAPLPGDVIFCRLSPSGGAGLEDLDWNIVRYRYQWRVDGALVRDITSAGRADAIPRDTAAAGQTLECTVTPSDGTVNGTPRLISVVVGGTTCYANCDHSTATPALNVADFTCFLQRYAAQDAYANCDASTATPTLNVADFTCFLQKYAGGCP